MARPLRIQFPGAVYHVTSRGNARADIFRSANDRSLFLDTLARVCGRHQWRCFAWCLMDNHYHLVVETGAASLASGMRQLNGIYTQSFNRLHGRVGHLFQGRYKAMLVDAEAYLLEVVRYTLLNPVRARLVKAAGQWRWSSYRATIGRVPAEEWLAADELLSRFAVERTAACRGFVRFIRDAPRQPELWQKLRAQIYLGDEAFAERMRERVDCRGDLCEIPRIQRASPALPLDRYRERYSTRDEAMAQAYASGAFTMKQIAAGFGVHYSTVSRALRRLDGAA